jgi:uncharacterized damage-inducible protein DinB
MDANDKGAVPDTLEEDPSMKEIQEVQTSPIFVGNYSDARFGIWVKEWFGKLHERVRELEWWRKDIQRRLQEGAQSFDDLRKAIRPQPKPLWVIFSFALTVAMIITGAIWTAAHYPNRNEFDSLKDHVVKMELHFTDEIGNLKVGMAELKGTVDTIKDSTRRVESAQKDNSDKLDRLLDRRK